METIRSVSSDQVEIISNIITLYCPDRIECDPTYSKGVFYKKIAPPKHKFDLAPQLPSVIQSDCRNLPLPSGSIGSLMFDPPFVGGSVGDGKRGIIKSRFGYYKTIPILWEMYAEALAEFQRVLRPGGVLVFKCQDSVESGKQYLSHVKIIQQALKVGFYPKDLFVLIAKNRLMSPNMLKRQLHARKFHSYFLVFLNERCPVNYKQKE